MRTSFASSATAVGRLTTCLALACALAACQGLPADWFERWHRPAGDSRTGGREIPVATDKFILFPEDHDVIGQVQMVIARQEDTLLDIARRYNLGFEEITQANPGVDPWLPGQGTRIVLPTQFILPDAPRDGIVLNLATMRLFYFPKTRPPEVPTVVTHPIGIGRMGWATPVGTTKVIAKTRKPTWNVPASIRREHAQMGDPLPAQVGPGPDNPLGKFALRLARPGYLIHGTNKPAGIGMRVSHGCIQLYPEDIGVLFEQVPVGTPVHIVNQPVLAGWLDGTLYMEAHQPLEDDHRDWRTELVEPLLQAAVIREGRAAGVSVDWDKAARLVASPRGFPVPISMGSPGVEEVMLAAQQVQNTLPRGANYRGEIR